MKQHFILSICIGIMLVYSNYCRSQKSDNPSFKQATTTRQQQNLADGFSLTHTAKGFSFVNVNGKPVFNTVYDSARAFSNGRAAVKVGNRWGFIDTTGNLVVSAVYDKVFDFIETVTDGTLNGNSVSFDMNGKVFEPVNTSLTSNSRMNPPAMPNFQNTYRTPFAAARTNTGTASCPANIDFEFGNFQNWKCDTGSTYVVDSTNVVTTTTTIPTYNRHTIISRSSAPNALDPYGNFPINAPGGSGYTLKLGNDSIGGFAEKVRYVIHVPVNDPDYSITYQYAVVFENPNVNTGGVHKDWQQPRFTANMIDSAANDTLKCASFLYVASLALTVPGFYTSPILGNIGSPIRCKSWTPVYINLSKYPGRTLYFDLTTADCTLKGHFGYAYFDVLECGIAATATYSCVGSHITTLTAPPGFKTYQWYDSTNNPVGNTQTVTINPGPPLGSSYRVVVNPYDNTGCGVCDCSDTLTVKVQAKYPSANAGPPSQICEGKNTNIGSSALAGLSYSWLPTLSLSSSTIAMPVASPTATTMYTLQVTDNVTSCTKKDSVLVTVIPRPRPAFTTNQNGQCLYGNNFLFSNTSTYAGSGPSYQWTFGDGTGSMQASPSHTYSTAGIFIIKLIVSANGCTDSTTRQITIYPTPVPSFSINAQSQCISGNSFVFSGTSNLPTGNYTYYWTFGDGASANTANSTHVFSAVGNYSIKYIVTSPQGCRDSVSLPVSVIPMPQVNLTSVKAAFCQGDSSLIIAHAVAGYGSVISYQWFRNGLPLPAVSDSILKVVQDGLYTVIVKNSFGCSTTSTSIQIIVYPLPAGTILPPNSYNICEGATVSLSATGGFSYQWFLNSNLINGATGSTYLAQSEGVYTVRLVTDKGCVAMANNSITMKLIRKPVANFSFANYCVNLPVNFTNSSTVTPGDFTAAAWNFGDGSISNLLNPVHYFTQARSYRVQLIATSTTCVQLSDTMRKSIIIEQPLVGLRYPLVNAVYNKPQQLDARPIGDSYLWQPTTGLNSNSIINPVFTYTKEQEYLIRIRRQSSCIITDTVLVRVFKDGDIYVPKAWSPNNDGHNDRLYPILTGMMELKIFRIFDRWGKLMFESRQKGDGWNGVFNSVNQPSETYTWTVDAIDPDGHPVRKDGNSVLIR